MNVPINANAKDTLTFNNGDADVNNIRVINTPKRAESIVPAVVGETNLFLVNCCIINPAILILDPAIKILINLGSLLINKTSDCSSVKLNKSVGERFDTPTKIDATDNKINANIK